MTNFGWWRWRGKTRNETKEGHPREKDIKAIRTKDQ